jgi:hypothetical protein
MRRWSDGLERPEGLPALSYDKVGSTGESFTSPPSVRGQRGVTRQWFIVDEGLWGLHGAVVHVDFVYLARSTGVDHDVQDTMGCSIRELS